MNFREIKLEFFYIRKAFLEYHKGWAYIYNKYFVAPRLLKTKQALDKPINRKDLSVHILTCHRDLIMSVWSLASYYQNTTIIGQLYIHSDGSLTDKDKAILKNFFPISKIEDTKNFEDKYIDRLENFPTIKKFRIELTKFFLLKKIVDQHFVSDSNLHLVIDSDLLWLKKIDEIEEGIDQGANNSLMITNNGLAQVYFKGGVAIDDKAASFNSGIVLYKKENFDLDKFTEYLEKIDIDDPRNVHFIEQAGFAYCLKNLVGLPLEKYHIQGDIAPETVMKHYTSPRRAQFYFEGLPIMKDKI